MDYKRFESIVNLMVSHNKRTDDLNKLGIDSYAVFPDMDLILDCLWAEILTRDGKEWFDWFMYDKGYYCGTLREDLKAWDGKKEICKDLKGLHKYLTANGYFRANG